MNKRFYLTALLIMMIIRAPAQLSPIAPYKILTTSDGDTLSLTKEDFTTINLFHPKLVRPEFTSHPQLLYALALNLPDSSNNLLFAGDAGCDYYCRLYAFFLKQRNGIEEYASVRNTINRIFSSLNRLFEGLVCGGTYYAHMEERIPAYAEYSVYLYSFYDAPNPLNIAKQKRHYIALLRQIVEDHMVVDDDMVDCDAGRKEKLINAIEAIDSLITNKFLLDRAIAFQADLSCGS